MSFSGPYFSTFGLDTERIGVFLCIQSDCGTILTTNLQLRTLLWQTFLLRFQVSLKEMSQFIGKLCYSAISVLPAPVYNRSLQKKYIYLPQILLGAFLNTSSHLYLFGRQTSTCFLQSYFIRCQHIWRRNKTFPTKEQVSFRNHGRTSRDKLCAHFV